MGARRVIRGGTERKRLRFWREWGLGPLVSVGKGARRAVRSRAHGKAEGLGWAGDRSHHPIPSQCLHTGWKAAPKHEVIV